MSELYTIGHSNHSTENFLGLLSKHDITAVCDVRSQPYSKFNPQFNRENIQKDLNDLASRNILDSSVAENKICETYSEEMKIRFE